MRKVSHQQDQSSRDRAQGEGHGAWSPWEALKRGLAAPGGPARGAALLVCAGLFVAIFQDNLLHFVKVWTTDENYSHGFLVPLISLYFAGQAARRGPTPIEGGVILGAFLLTISLMLGLVTIPLPIPFLGDLGFLVGFMGVFALILGRSALARYWFPIVFLGFMIPLPIALYSRIASPLQLLASEAASTVMNATGVPVLCEGNHMTLPGGVQLFVAEACSGMRQLTGFLALTTAMSYLVARPLWQRLVVMASALPIALSANIARVVLTGYIMHYCNARYASGAYHTLEGLLMMGFGLAMLSALCWLLDRLPRQDGACQGAGTMGRAALPRADERAATPGMIAPTS